MPPFDRSHTSSYLYRFRNKARYWSKNANAEVKTGMEIPVSQRSASSRE